jgi:hypothetical protein
MSMRRKLESRLFKLAGDRLAFLVGAASFAELVAVADRLWRAPVILSIDGFVVHESCFDCLPESPTLLHVDPVWKADLAGRSKWPGTSVRRPETSPSPAPRPIKNLPRRRSNSPASLDLRDRHGPSSEMGGNHRELAGRH